MLISVNPCTSAVKIATILYHFSLDASEENYIHRMHFAVYLKKRCWPKMFAR